MKMLTQKMMWLGMVLVLIVLTVFGVAMMGSVLGSKPKEVPVALVILDQPAELPTGETFAIGEMIRERLLSSPAMPFVWHVVDSEEKAREGLDKREYYGAMVIPADLSSGLLSLATHSPIHPNVRIISNEGMNTQASMVVRQAMGQAMNMINGELLQQLLGQIGQQTEQIPIETAKALMTPVNVQEEVVHPPGVNHAAGNAPGLFTQIIWIGSMVTGVVLLLASQKAVAAGSRRWTVSALQAIGGLAIVGIASCFTIWMASSWYGMELANAGETWLFLWLAGSAFFLLQSSLLNWIGFRAIPLLVLLMFFSVPLLNMAPEFLSQTTRDWIYSWTPLRFAAGGLREVMYFGGLDAAHSNALILWGVAGGFLVLLLSSGFKANRATDAAPTSVTGDTIK
ncbi:YhgE/Pip domain-containing protein [Paenibacillus sp. Y412MC10]|uniref:YhgE/Pip domain-containing protein n=1 Tax=Geobacillus sp. (strain Y412MC10) TaxID=481743 RepID=UPI0001788E49|nr:ABC transporter permease [Paenibacillus sp. Y412MC10]ACX67119.1 YhgE/Pip N-terminal domain protein [Paenibacillus sp. Y412MC10]